MVKSKVSNNITLLLVIFSQVIFVIEGHPELSKNQPSVTKNHNAKDSFSSCPKNSSTSSSSCTMPSESLPLSDLPRWDLERHFGYESPFSSVIDDELESLKDRAKLFREIYEVSLSSSSSSSSVTLFDAITEYEEIKSHMSKISSYLHLSYDVKLDNDALKKRRGTISQVQSTIQGDYLEWFELDIAAWDDDAMQRHYFASSPTLSTTYGPFIEETRRSRPHNLSKDVERALTVREPYVGTGPLVSFFDRELSLMTFDLNDGKPPVNMEILLNKLSSSKDATVRAALLKALNDGLGGSVCRIAALSLSAVAGSWHIESKERKFAALRSSRNLSNNCPDDVVDSLLRGVRGEGVLLCQRYYALKKGILKSSQGLTTFTWSDRNAPLDLQRSSSEEKKIEWTEAVSMVERGYRKFSPRMATLFLSMVESQRIDVPALQGKKGGAYCAGVVPGVGPFQLLNYDGTKNDVATLAHESGHGAHDLLAYDKGYLQYHPPLTLAETASIFGEMIVFRDLLDLAESKEERLELLTNKIDSIVNSVVRQCSFDRFEELAHTARKEGELSSEELDNFWMQAVTEYYGTAGAEDCPFDSYDDISHLWAYVPHFHHVPFYVYSYAFADLVVGTLYHNFQTHPEGFEERLIDLLSAGGTKNFKDALAPFGLDPTDSMFWEDALRAHLGGMIDEAEGLAKELGFI